MFTDIERCLGTSIKQLLLKLMVKTGKEEIQIVELTNDYHQGVPAIITIIVDGWSKRSHKHSYNANSQGLVYFWGCH